MSTELINRHREGYQLTGFYGGDTRGYCLQITSDPGYIQLTRDAAACLAADIFRYFLETPSPAGDARDAERYRWLRGAGVDHSTDIDVVGFDGECLNHEELDAAIDAARAAAKREGK